MKNNPAGDTSLHQGQGPIGHKQTNYNQTKQTSTIAAKTFNTTKTSQSKRPYKLKHQNSPFRSLPPPQGFQFAYKSPLT
jgi:hypothetical protein